jgi:hypothetical protein
VHSWAETLFFSFFAKRTTHEAYLLNDYPTCVGCPRARQIPLKLTARKVQAAGKPVFMGFLELKMKKTA